MISFTIQLYDLETGNQLFSRKQFSWPALPRKEEMVMLETSTADYHDCDFFKVEDVWHYLESGDYYPQVCVVDFNVEHKVFERFLNRPEWTDSLLEVEKSPS